MEENLIQTRFEYSSWFMFFLDKKRPALFLILFEHKKTLGIIIIITLQSLVHQDPYFLWHKDTFSHPSHPSNDSFTAFIQFVCQSVDGYVSLSVFAGLSLFSHHRYLFTKNSFIPLFSSFTLVSLRLSFLLTSHSLNLFSVSWGALLSRIFSQTSFLMQASKTRWML